jgi:hypothetical protein
MANVRRCIWEWESEEDWHEAIECAVRADGTSPASDFLDELLAGAWVDDPDHVPPADDEQIHDYAKLFAKIEYVGRHGQPDTATSVNHLQEGIWEFKHNTRRLSYWDTDGNGNFTPKPRYGSANERPDPIPAGGYWWYPEMDTVLRLGCPWPKTGTYAPPQKIAEALDIRTEDCSHDIA